MDKFCILPWISLEASPVGTVRPCCLADGEIQKVSLVQIPPDKVKYNLNNDNLDTIRNSIYMTNLRQKFLDGEQPELCRRCWAEEDAGRKSKRMHTLDKIKIDYSDWTEKAQPLQFLDLKLGNICNLACRICGSWSSSTYAAEELKELPVEKRKESFAYKMNHDGQWPRKSERFWDDLHAHKDIRYLEFTGGEPFMIKEHFEYLQQLVDDGYAKNISIHYNTNGTLYPENTEIWKHFKNVEIALSIDDIGKRFEYQRDGANWLVVMNNLYRFKKLREKSSNITLQVCSTINVFNVLHLEHLANWISTQGFDFVYWNMLHDAEVHCITSLPDNVKQEVAKRLSNARVSDDDKKEFLNVIQFMNSKTSTMVNELKENIKILDKRKGQDINDYLPVLAEMLYG